MSRTPLEDGRSFFFGRSSCGARVVAGGQGAECGCNTASALKRAYLIVAVYRGPGRQAEGDGQLGALLGSGHAGKELRSTAGGWRRQRRQQAAPLFRVTGRCGCAAAPDELSRDAYLRARTHTLVHFAHRRALQRARARQRARRRLRRQTHSP